MIRPSSGTRYLQQLAKGNDRLLVGRMYAWSNLSTRVSTDIHFILLRLLEPVHCAGSCYFIYMVTRALLH